jgi:galactokinase
MVLDAAGLLTGRPAGSFKVEVVPVLSGREQAELEELRQARRRAAAAESEAGRLSRSLAARLAGDGLTLRDVGAVMGLSHQRVAQLVG